MRSTHRQPARSTPTTAASSCIPTATARPRPAPCAGARRRNDAPVLVRVQTQNPPADALHWRRSDLGPLVGDVLAVNGRGRATACWSCSAMPDGCAARADPRAAGALGIEAAPCAVAAHRRGLADPRRPRPAPPARAGHAAARSAWTGFGLESWRTPACRRGKPRACRPRPCRSSKATARSPGRALRDPRQPLEPRIVDALVKPRARPSPPTGWTGRGRRQSAYPGAWGSRSRRAHRRQPGMRRSSRSAAWCAAIPATTSRWPTARRRPDAGRAGHRRAGRQRRAGGGTIRGTPPPARAAAMGNKGEAALVALEMADLHRKLREDPREPPPQRRHRPRGPLARRRRPTYGHASSSGAGERDPDRAIRARAGARDRRPCVLRDLVRGVMRHAGGWTRRWPATSTAPSRRWTDQAPPRRIAAYELVHRPDRALPGGDQRGDRFHQALRFRARPHLRQRRARQGGASLRAASGARRRGAEPRPAR